MNRRGFITDAMLYMCLIFAVSIALFVTYLIFSEMNTSIQSSGVTSEGKAMFNTQTNKMDNVMDAVIITIFVGVVISMLVMSFLLRSNPVFFFLMLFVVIFMSAIAGYLSNAFSFFTSTSTFSVVSASFPMTTFLMDNYLIINVIIVFLMMIVFFAKSGEGV